MVEKNNKSSHKSAIKCCLGLRFWLTNSKVEEKLRIMEEVGKLKEKMLKNSKASYTPINKAKMITILVDKQSS